MDPGKPKDISPILEKYKLSPQEVAVFGDKQEIDIAHAKSLGCKTVLVVEYTRATSDTFDWSEIDLEKI
jgi:FMN phosphatase YigB (HAD superfamily)